MAADGGANRLFAVNSDDSSAGTDASAEQQARPFDDLHCIIGDLDSLSDEARDYFTSRTPREGSSPCQVIHDPDQYSTDFGKAVKHIRSTTSSSTPGVPIDIVAMGGLGGRVDQGLSQLHHLFIFQTGPGYSDGKMFIVSGESLTFLLKTGRHRIVVREKPPGGQGRREDVFDKYVGIVPIKEPSVISTTGLEWDVTDWKTEFGGMISTSNHILPTTEVVEITTTKDVLFTVALRRSPDS